MRPLTTTSPALRLRREMPPSAPLPAAAQTLACRRWPLEYLRWCHARYGDRFVVYPLDMPPLVFLADPAEIHAVLTAPVDVLHPGAGGAILAPLVGKRSFMLCEEAEHLQGRKAAMLAFTRAAVESRAEIVARTIREEIESWPLDSPTALHQPIRVVALQVILQAIFCDYEALNLLRERLLELLSITSTMLLQEPKLRHLPGWRQTWRRFLTCREQVDAMLFELIASHRSADAPPSGDLLGDLLAAANADGTPMSHCQVRDHLMSMIVAGHETTTAEIAWAIQLLAHNQDVQTRLAREIDGGDGRQYLKAVVQEVLRHRPTFLFAIPRAVNKTTTIGDHVYRQPAHLLGCTYLMHHNPSLYPKPDQFRPQRFIDESRELHTWLPWGTGHKRCLGRHLAVLEAETLLAELLASRRVLPASRQIEPARWRSAILVPQHGCRVVLQRRPRAARPTPAPARAAALVTSATPGGR
jgi:cytochrome P450 family 135